MEIERVRRRRFAGSACTSGSGFRNDLNFLRDCLEVPVRARHLLRYLEESGELGVVHTPRYRTITQLVAISADGLWCREQHRVDGYPCLGGDHLEPLAEIAIESERVDHGEQPGPQASGRDGLQHFERRLAGLEIVRT